MRILLADDDPVFRLIAHKTLRSLGHDCDVVTDGTQAWHTFGLRHYDVVISDWTMPGLSGLELVRNIRADGADTYTYVIMVTGHARTEEILEGMSAGADDYLVKPLDPDALQARLVGAERVTTLHGRLSLQREQLEGLNEELSALARRDPLTGLGNRRALNEQLELIEARVARYGHRYCIALLDVDLFKSYNDVYGHVAGDKVLQTVADALLSQARGGDAVFRYGGEEFLCIYPEQTLEGGWMAADRMRQGLKALAVPHRGDPSGFLGLSAGVAIMDPDRPRSPDEVLEDADAALYRAKDLGRDRVERAVLEPLPIVLSRTRSRGTRTARPALVGRPESDPVVVSVGPPAGIPTVPLGGGPNGPPAPSGAPR